MDSQRLIEFIVWYATKKRGQVSRLRLMKFLYLADWLSVRQSGQRLTDYPWIFYHYGPYAVAAQQAIEMAVSTRKISVEQISDADDRDVFLYRRFGGDPEIWREIGVGLDARLRRIIDEWIHRPRNEFLDFVYFGTEPMLAARRGESLDFATVQRDAGLVPVSSDLPKPRRSAAAQAAVVQFLARVRETKPLDPPPIYDSSFDRALSILNAQDLPSLELRGEVEIGPDTNLRTSE